MIVLDALLQGILMGLLFALVALGLTIIFGVMDIVNFAHGEFLMIGMYTAYWTSLLLHIDPLITLPASAIVGMLLGLASYYWLVKYLTSRSDDCSTLWDLWIDALLKISRPIPFWNRLSDHPERIARRKEPLRWVHSSSIGPNSPQPFSAFLHFFSFTTFSIEPNWERPSGRRHSIRKRRPTWEFGPIG